MQSIIIKADIENTHELEYELLKARVYKLESKLNNEE